MDTELDISTNQELGSTGTQSDTKVKISSALERENARLQTFNYNFDKLLDRVATQFNIVCQTYPKHPSIQHSAWVVQEEFDEVLKELRAKDYDINMTRLTDELVDLIVAACRMIMDNSELYKCTTGCDMKENIMEFI